MNKQTTIKEFLNLVENTYNKHFPNSICQATLYKGLGTSISINCYLAGNKEELINGYVQNDMFSIRFWMHENENNLQNATLETILNDNLKIECDAKSYTIKPDNDYMCYGRKKLSYRKTTGDYTKILKSLDKFFSKLKDELKKDLEDNKIHDNFKELLVNKIQ